MTSVIPARSRRQPIFYTIMLLALMSFYFGGAALLWQRDGEGFARFEAAQGVWPVDYAHEHTISHPYAGLPLPFFDLKGVLSWRECALKGYAVMIANPCDPLGRLSNYTPLVPHLPWEWLGLNRVIPIGMAMDALFLLVLAFALSPATPTAFALAAIGALSPAVFLAVERANLDVLIFTLVIGALLLPQRFQWSRFSVLAAALVGGLLKFYPLVMLLALLRERRRLFLPLCAAAVVVMAAFVAFFRAELTAVPALLPDGGLFQSAFGSPILPEALRHSFDMPPAWGGFLRCACIALGLIGAWKVSKAFHSVQIDILDRNMGLLLAGGILTASCFYAGVNVYYRAIFILPVFPGLLALHAGSTDGTQRGLLLACLAGAVVCLYADMARVSGTPLLVGQTGIGSLRFAVPLMREAAWWFETTLVAGVTIALLRQARAVRDMMETVTSLRLKYRTEGVRPS